MTIELIVVSGVTDGGAGVFADPTPPGRLNVKNGLSC